MKKGTKRLKLAICIFWVFWHYISSMRQIGSFCPTIVVFLRTLSKTDCLYVHYHLQVQANPKKIVQKKTMLFLASMGETGLTHYICFEFSLGPFKVVEAEGGCLVKEADFEAEKFFFTKTNNLAFQL